MARSAAPRLSSHELAESFPLMSDLEYQALKEDIRVRGQQQPIIVFEGKILDGRNRYRACEELGLAPQLEQFKGTAEEAKKFSVSANLMRRHLSKSQKAMIVAQSGLVAPPAAPGRRRAYGKGRDAIMEVAKRYGVNHVTIYKAAYVAAQNAELAEKVVSGELSVGKAEAQVRASELAAPDRRAEKGDGLAAGTSFLSRLSDRFRFTETELSRARSLLQDFAEADQKNPMAQKLLDHLEAFADTLAQAKLDLEPCLELAERMRKPSLLSRAAAPSAGSSTQQRSRARSRGKGVRQ
jgi:ParB-like nuclease family protein